MKTEVCASSILTTRS